MNNNIEKVNKLLNKIRIKTEIDIDVYIEDDIIIYYSPALMVTGYGNDTVEANESFDHCCKLMFKELGKVNKLYDDLTNIGWETDGMTYLNYTGSNDTVEDFTDEHVIKYLFKKEITVPIKYLQKPSIDEISKLIENIKNTELVDNIDKAVHHIFTFLFGNISNKTYLPIILLINDNRIFELNYFYIVAIISITYQYKDNIKDYDSFYNKASNYCKENMNEIDYKLTFDNFKD